jgi:hypothetical protein
MKPDQCTMAQYGTTQGPTTTNLFGSHNNPTIEISNSISPDVEAIAFLSKVLIDLGKRAYYDTLTRCIHSTIKSTITLTNVNDSPLSLKAMELLAAMEKFVTTLAAPKAVQEETISQTI